VRHVTIVGAGWSGLACAVELATAGVRVTLLDAAPQPGGRARGVRVTLGDRDYPLDNGQHLLIGAYAETLRLMRAVGVDADAAFVRTPFALRYPDGVSLVAGRAPAPWHLALALLRAKGLTWRERLAMIALVERFKRQRWSVTPDCSAAELLRGHPQLLIERLWQPLCIAALNVPLDVASAQTFLVVLRDSLGADAAASDLLLPRGDLSQLFPTQAVQSIERLGGAVRLRTLVDAVQPSAGGWQLRTRDASLDADAVVLALPPPRAAALLDGLGDRAATASAQLRAVAMAPIATVYLRYARSELEHPVYALRDDPTKGNFGQWVFDRGALDARCAGVLSVVISAAGAHEDLAHEALAAAVAQQLTAALGLPAPLATATIVDKRATIVPAPNVQRPPTQLLPGLLLAGDAAASPYPSTIEGSVRSGLAAARALLAH
jgi:squalene-associated FAD-dependent desaturase